jgi:hypothetical protein
VGGDEGRDARGEFLDADDADSNGSQRVDGRGLGHGNFDGHVVCEHRALTW